jgi:hypothetical protein
MTTPMTSDDYERVRSAIESAAFGGHALRDGLCVRVGIFSKRSFRNFLTGLRCGGQEITWSEPVGWLNCDWLVHGSETAMEAVRQYCARIC